jgi:heme-degrading monooxygenase HmoA
MTIVTVFRSRLREGVESEYGPLAAVMDRIASSMEGFIDQKRYDAPDGERVTVVRFADEASQQRWARHPEHLLAQRRGHDEFYSWFDISVSQELHGRTFSID